MSWVAVAGAAVGAYGAYSSNRNSRRAADAQERAMQQATTQLSPFAVFGGGGMGASYGHGIQHGAGGMMGNHMMPPTGSGEGMNGNVSDVVAQILGRAPSGGGGMPSGAAPSPFGLQGPAVQLNAGDLEGVRAALSQFATQGMPSASSGLPPGVAEALGGFRSASGAPVDMGTAGLDFLDSNATRQFTDASNALTGARRPDSYQGAYDTALSSLRGQANEQNQRNFASLQDNLFATGRMGSTGGGLQTEAFARGLAQADAGYQLQAQQAGMAARGQDNELLNSAFNRFAGTAGIARDLNSERFSRSMYGDERQYGRAQNWLGTQVNMAGLPASLQGAQMQNVLAALGGQAGIQQQGLNLFGAGLSAEQAAANARIGSGSNMAQIVGSPSFGAPGQANAAMWSQLGSSMMNPNGMGGLLGRIFGGQNQPAPQSNWEDFYFGK